MLVNQFNRSCNDFAHGAFNAVRAAKTLIADTFHNVNPASFLNPVKVLNVLAFSGRDVMPGGFDDGASILVAIGKIGGDGEVSNVCTGDFLSLDASDGAAELVSSYREFVQIPINCKKNSPPAIIWAENVHRHANVLDYVS